MNTNRKSNRHARTVKGIQSRIDKRNRQRIMESIVKREGRTA